MKMRFLSMLLALVILVSALPTGIADSATSLSNYDLLVSYIDTYGRVDSGGVAYISEFVYDLDGKLNHYYTLRSKGELITLELYTESQNNPAVHSTIILDIFKNWNHAWLSIYLNYHQDGEWVETFSYSRGISFGSLSLGGNFTVYNDSEYLPSETASGYCTARMMSFTSYWERFMTEKLGFGMYGLGFTRFTQHSPLNYVVNGTVIDGGGTTVTLSDCNGIVATTISDSETGAFCFDDIPKGDYVITATKDYCVDFEFPINVSQNLSIEFQMTLRGDINGDGKVNTKDWTLLYNHISEYDILSGYELERADVNDDGKVNTKDWTRLYNHINESDPLWPDPKYVGLTVWVPDEDLDSGWLSERMRIFEKAHPEYTIGYNIVRCREEEAAIMIETNSLYSPDVYMFNSDHMQRLYDAGALVALEGKYEEQVRNDNVSTMIQSVTYSDGSIYGFPVAPVTWLMYYNKAVFSESDVQSLDVMLSKGKVAFDLVNGWYNGAFFFGAGGTLFGPDCSDALAGVDFNGEIGNAVARKMVDMYNSGVLCNGGQQKEVEMLLDGTVGAIFSASWNYEILKRMLGSDLGVAVLPAFQVDGLNCRMKALSGSKAIGVNGAIKDPEEKALAMELAAFLSSEESQLKRFEMRGATPVHKNFVNSSVVKDNPVAAVELQVIDQYWIALPCIPEMNKYWAPMRMFGENIVYGVVTEENVDSMLEQILQMING